MSEEEPTKGAPFQSVSTMMGSQNKHENKNKKPDKQTDKKQMQSSGWKNGGSEDFFTRRHFTEGQVKKRGSGINVHMSITAHKKKRKTDGGQRSTWSISPKNDQDKIKNIRICLH